ncbi:alpha-aminoadipic semialdehyde synthase [Citrus sinensis]|nr:alpha-aminoadipic semialdehyde synthase [Citrus sinensis]
MLGNGVVGILAETSNKWERRAPLTPSHCSRLLLAGRQKSGVARILVQPSTKRVFNDAQYEEAGCEITSDLSESDKLRGVIVLFLVQLEMILPDRAYAFFSHTHKAQPENMALLDKILAQRVSLFDYELVEGNQGKRRLIAFGKFAGRAAIIDLLKGLGQRYLNLGYSTPFLTLGAAYMYPSLAAAKAAIISVGEEIATEGLPSGICPLVFVFTGSGHASIAAQEIFKLLPHTFVDPSRLPELFEKAGDSSQSTCSSSTKRVFQVYGCVVTSENMVEPKDSSRAFDKNDYYEHPEQYNPIFHEKIAPYASAIINCIYWEKQFPRLLSTQQLRDLAQKGCPLVGISDLTCDMEGSIEILNQTTTIDSPFFSLASVADIAKLPGNLRRACIAHGGALTSLYEYILTMRNSG